ncbi:MAG: hypothetical protein R3320_11455 [Nitriliruptorales bacterium]|nr:hypothetical protein [Nitriliruptorales bacterium]
MADHATDPVTVGTYVNEELAQKAAGYLEDSDLADVTVKKVTDGVWQVRVPWAQAQHALRELRPHEQWAMQTHF